MAIGILLKWISSPRMTNQYHLIQLEIGQNGIYILNSTFQPGANDVWVVKRKGKRDLLLPYIPPVVLNVDIPNKRVDVDILEGLDDED